MDQFSAGTPSSSHMTSSSGTPTGSLPPGQDPGRSIDDVMSPIDMEVHIQTERLTVLMDDTIRRTKLALALPHLVKDLTTLQHCLTAHELEDVHLIYDQYSLYDMTSSASMLNEDAVDDVKAGNFTVNHRVSPELAHVLHIISSYPSVVAKAEQIIEKQYEAGESPATLYLDSLALLRQLLLQRLHKTAAAHLGEILRLRKVAANNARLVKEICIMEAAVHTDCQRHEVLMLEKNKVKEQLIKKLEILQRDRRQELAKIVLDSERQMVLATRAHTVQIEILNEEESSWTEACKILLEKNLVEEKALRMRRNKVITQLQSWIQKYDGEMSDKQQELEDVTKMYEEQAKRVVELEAELAEQDLTYIPEMEEKEAEYDQEMTGKMNMFMREHAARVIQFSWRMVLANRKEKARLRRLARRAAAKTAA